MLRNCFGRGVLCGQKNYEALAQTIGHYWNIQEWFRLNDLIYKRGLEVLKNPSNESDLQQMA